MAAQSSTLRLLARHFSSQDEEATPAGERTLCDIYRGPVELNFTKTEEHPPWEVNIAHS